MEFLNIGSTGFQEAMSQIMKGGVGNDSITDDSIVRLTKVIRVNEDKEDKIPSIMLVYGNDSKETITDFRNFSGKTEGAFAKQVQAHIWTLNTLGNPVSLEELQEALSDDANDSFTKLYELFVDKFNGAINNKSVGIEVDHDLTSQKYIITKYCDVSKFEHAAAEDDSQPF